jgi:hypothetical protein
MEWGLESAMWMETASNSGCGAGADCAAGAGCGAVWQGAGITTKASPRIVMNPRAKLQRRELELRELHVIIWA